MSNNVNKSTKTLDVKVDNADAALNASANSDVNTNSQPQQSVEDVLASLYDELDTLQLNREHNFYVVRSWLNLSAKNCRQITKRENGSGVPRLLFILPNGAQGEAKRHPASLRVKEGDAVTSFNIHQVVSNEFAEQSWGDEKDATQRQILVMRALIEAQKAGEKPSWYLYEVTKKSNAFRWQSNKRELTLHMWVLSYFFFFSSTNPSISPSLLKLPIPLLILFPNPPISVPLI